MGRPSLPPAIRRDRRSISMNSAEWEQTCNGASQLGLSASEYLRRLVAADLARVTPAPSTLFSVWTDHDLPTSPTPNDFDDREAATFIQADTAHSAAQAAAELYGLVASRIYVRAANGHAIHTFSVSMRESYYVEAVRGEE